MWFIQDKDVDNSCEPTAERKTVSDATDTHPNIGRRDLLESASVAAVLAAFAGPSIASIVSAETRSLSFRHLHTGERLDATYWADGTYQQDELSAVNRLLRDFRTGDVKPIDPGLLDRLHDLRRTMRSDAPFEVISGYRSPATNAALRRQSRAVAKNSFHMRGMAIDIRLPGRGISQLRHAALQQRAGGVGYYPESSFIHIDVGPLRRWSFPAVG
jgi:uncharacterized protein YcbK (DUF882 family)